MNELDELKKRRLEQLRSAHQEQLKAQLQEESELQQQIEALEEVVRARLTKEALQRYGNLKTAHPEKAVQLLAVLGQAIQTGQLRHMVDDEQLKKILEKLSEKRDFKIMRR